jgi:uncharacterized membrane protein
MPTIHESVEIERPREEVFTFATDPEQVPVWQSNITRYEQVSEGSRDKGATDRGAVRVAGRTIEFTAELVDWQPSETSVLRSLESPMSWEQEMRFEALDDARTRMTIHQEVGELGGFFGKLGDALVTRMYTRDVRSNLDNLKALLESD